MDKTKGRSAKEKRNSAIEIIIGMKRYYAQKGDKYLIDREIKRLVEKHRITYGDIAEYKEEIKKGLITPYWK